jgi:hypothetical protein
MPFSHREAPPHPDEPVARFLGSRDAPLVSAVARRHLAASTRGGSMTAWLDACTFLDGNVLKYRIVGEGGSGAMRKRALVAALDGEVAARKAGDAERAALNASNYDFEPEAQADGKVRVRLRPKRKAPMLIDVAMILESETGDLLSVEGRLVKAPSFWTRHVDIVRRYARLGGVRVPVSMGSKAQVRMLGASTFDMSYDYLSINGAPVADAAVKDPKSECTGGGAPGDAVGAASHHDRGVELHLRRSLDEASAEYGAALRLDPPRAPTAAERRLVERLAPRVFVTRWEPFALRDVAAVIHPTLPIIAYHLLWDDDVDYPDDNDPSDHELVWVGYKPDGTLERFWTYFHGRILDGGSGAVADAVAHDMRPAVLVQWGKHGSMPVGWRSQSIEPAAGETEAGFYPIGTPITLGAYNRGTFDKLVTVGAREADHPLARLSAWPRRFSGTWEEFSRFDRSIDALAVLRARSMVAVSRWNSATLNQRFLRYNFRPKVEWPMEEQ